MRTERWVWLRCPRVCMRHGTLSESGSRCDPLPPTPEATGHRVTPQPHHVRQRRRTPRSQRTKLGLVYGCVHTEVPVHYLDHGWVPTPNVPWRMVRDALAHAVWPRGQARGGRPSRDVEYSRARRCCETGSRSWVPLCSVHDASFLSHN